MPGQVFIRLKDGVLIARIGTDRLLVFTVIAMLAGKNMGTAKLRTEQRAQGYQIYLLELNMRWELDAKGATWRSPEKRRTLKNQSTLMPIPTS
jgi:hypothetical protein